MKVISLKTILLIQLSFCVIGAYGCGSGGAASTGSPGTPPPIPNPGQPASITLTSSARITNVGNGISLSARAVDSGGNGVPGVAIVFTSSGIGTLDTNYQVTDGNGYANSTLFSSAVGNTKVKAFTNSMAATLDLYFVDGQIKNRIKVSIDRNGNNTYDEPADFVVSGTSGEQVKIRATLTDAAGVPLSNKTITMSSSSGQVSFSGAKLTTDVNGDAYSFATFTNTLNTVYVDILATSDDGTVGTITLALQSFIIGDILFYADSYSVTAAQTAKLTACLVDDQGNPVKMADLKVNFSADNPDVGTMLPFTFTDATGCATNDFRAQTKGKVKITASFTSVSEALTLNVGNVVQPLQVIPGSPSVTQGSSMLLMVTGGVAPYTVTSLNPALTSPASWNVLHDGDSFQVAGVSTGIATIVVKDSANSMIQAFLTISNVIQPLQVIPSAPSATMGEGILLMVTGGLAPYTVTSLNLSLTDPDSWNVTSNGGTFQVTAAAAGTATIVVKDSAGTIVQVPLTIN